MMCAMEVKKTKALEIPEQTESQIDSVKDFVRPHSGKMPYASIQPLTAAWQ